MQECKSRLPIEIEPAATGMSLPNIFGSEFGAHPSSQIVAH